MNPPGPDRAPAMTLSAAARLWLWDYPRGSLPYDLTVLLLLALVFLTPAGFWADPMAGWR